MTGITLLEAKIRAPRRRQGILPRARLGGRVDREALPAVVLVSAPAGFGKTTFLVEWLGSGPAPAWLSLDRRDSDPTVFWTYVIGALQKVAPEVGAEALAALQSTPGALEAVISSLANDVGGLDHDVALVLDDYHMIEALAVHESMLFLLEHLPEQLHLIVASRTDPPWPLAGLRARGELVEVRATDLRFTCRRGNRLPERCHGPRPDSRRHRRPRRPNGRLDRRASARCSLPPGPGRPFRVHRDLRR